MNEYQRETLPCETCGTPTPYQGTKRCNNCWEVERRLPDYLKSLGGKVFVKRLLPALDDWVDKRPDAWDYEAVLKENDVSVKWGDTLIDGEGNTSPAGEYAGWGFSWMYGGIHIGQTTETIARKAAALFVSLWLRGVSASFADKLMAGYVWYLELQEGTSLTFLAEIKEGWATGIHHFLVTREGLCRQAHLTFETQDRIITALAPKPDEEIIVTFSKRNKCP